MGEEEECCSAGLRACPATSFRCMSSVLFSCTCTFKSSDALHACTQYLGSMEIGFVPGDAQKNNAMALDVMRKVSLAFNRETQPQVSETKP